MMAYVRRMRRGYKRRTTFRSNYKARFLKPSITPSKTGHQLSVYMNPFSTKTTNPKIPDGKAYHSAGLRLQAVGEYVNDSGVMHFLIVPGLKTGMVATGVASSGIPNNSLHYTNHVELVGTTAYDQSDSSALAAWRVVSQGAKFTLTNNSDENDGWWECIRVQFERDDDTTFDIVSTAPYVGGLAAVGGLPQTDQTRQMVEHPTYVTGKLRDIHRHIFQLKPNTNDHEFTRLKHRDNTPEQLLNGTIDPSYDMIYLRVHGRGGTTPTRLMAHVVCNQEIIYQEDTPLARYHSESDSNPVAMMNMRRKLQHQSHKAAKRTMYTRE